MKLSMVERLILTNQYKILASLDPDEADFYNDAQTVLQNGYEAHYDDFVMMFSDGSNVLTEQESDEVLTILEMFDALKTAYDEMAEKPDVSEYQIKFAGFDGNHESKQMAYARYYCRSGTGHFTDIDKGDNFNSHSRVLDRYRRQLVEWKKTPDQINLTKDDVERIAAAAIHPEMRTK